MQFNGEFWYKTILNTMSISYLVTLLWRYRDFHFGEQPLILLMWYVGHAITGKRRSVGGFFTHRKSQGNVHSLQQSKGLHHSSAFVNGAMHFIGTTRLWRHQALRWWNLALFQARRRDIPLRKWRRVQGRVEMEQKAWTWCLHTCERRNVSHAKFKPQLSLFSRLS